MQEPQVWSLGQEYPLEKKMAAHSSLLAWEIPWTEELGTIHGITRVGHRLASKPPPPMSQMHTRWMREWSCQISPGRASWRWQIENWAGSDEKQLLSPCVEESPEQRATRYNGWEAPGNKVPLGVLTATWCEHRSKIISVTLTNSEPTSKSLNKNTCD